MSLPLYDILQFEYWMESGFASILSGLVTAPVYDTATRPETAVTPRIEVKCVVGSYKEHRHQFGGQTVTIGGTPYPVEVFDAYESIVEVTVVTNRQDNTITGDHRRLLGKVREKMLKWLVFAHWTGNVCAPQDVRPIGTADSFIDDQDCDFTVMVHEVPFVVNTQDVWPDSLTLS